MVRIQRKKVKNNRSGKMLGAVAVILLAAASVLFRAQFQVQQKVDDDGYNNDINVKSSKRNKRGKATEHLQKKFDLTMDRVTNMDTMNTLTDDDDNDDTMKLILSGRLNLIDITSIRKIGEGEPTSDGTPPFPYSARGVFCELDWSRHKNDAASVPMFKDLIANSPACRRTRVTVDLLRAASEARIQSMQDEMNANASDTDADHEATATSKSKSMKPTGFVFHESRCGSTLVANSLASFDPPTTRVYSESPPPITVAKAAQAAIAANPNVEADAIRMVQDTLFLMGRTSDMIEERLFFKIQSIGSKSIDIFRKAFPSSPFIYVFRDPVQVMRSHLKGQDTTHAVCTRSRRNPPADLLNHIANSNSIVQKASSLSTEEFCAAHLATLCVAAEKAIQESEGWGRAVNYEALPQILIDDIIPHHFLGHWDKHENDGKEKEHISSNLTEDEIARVLEVNKKYSKGRKGKGRAWEADSTQKEDTAWDELKDASSKFLLPVYERLQVLARDGVL